MSGGRGITLLCVACMYCCLYWSDSSMNSFVLRRKKNGVNCALSLCTRYPKITMSDFLYVQAISKTLSAFKNPFQVYLLSLTSPSALILSLIRASFTRKTGNSQNQTEEKARGPGIWSPPWETYCVSSWVNAYRVSMCLISSVNFCCPSLPKCKILL